MKEQAYGDLLLSSLSSIFLNLGFSFPIFPLSKYHMLNSNSSTIN